MVASPTRRAADEPGAAPPRSNGTPAGRRVRRPRALPGTRAVVGGLLVAVAAVGVFVASHRAGADHDRAYVVARHDVQAGQRLNSADFVTRPATLPDVVARRSFTGVAQLRGAVALSHIDAGELVQRGQVADGSRQPGHNQVSFAVDASRAAGGDLQPGDRIALLVTPDGNTRPQIVATGLEVVRIDRSSSAVERAGQLTILVSADGDQTLGVARALNPDQVTVVRTTGVRGADRLSTTSDEGS